MESELQGKKPSTHVAASSKTASPTHYQLSYSSPLPPSYNLSSTRQTLVLFRPGAKLRRLLKERAANVLTLAVTMPFRGETEILLTDINTHVRMLKRVSALSPSLSLSLSHARTHSNTHARARPYPALSPIGYTRTLTHRERERERERERHTHTHTHTHTLTQTHRQTHRHTHRHTHTDTHTHRQTDSLYVL